MEIEYPQAIDFLSEQSQTDCIYLDS